MSHESRQLREFRLSPERPMRPLEAKRYIKRHRDTLEDLRRDTNRLKGDALVRNLQDIEWYEAQIKRLEAILAGDPSRAIGGHGQDQQNVISEAG